MLAAPVPVAPIPATTDGERRVILVTGGSRGIGAATALRAAQLGYAVGVNYRSRQAEADRLVATIRAAGGEATALRADISQEAEVVRLFAELDAQLGPLTALVNNAGTLEAQARLEDITGERLARVFTTNVFGAFFCCREALRRMSTARGGGGGGIVNISSLAARTGSPGEYIDYAASKGALDTMTVGLAREVAGEGVRVNGVRAGFIETEIHAQGGEPGRVARLAPTIPLGRGGQPEEVAAAILWLLSEEASYVTGSFIDVAGGR